jgi:hypothetical protein
MVEIKVRNEVYPERNWNIPKFIFQSSNPQ